MKPEIPETLIQASRDIVAEQPDVGAFFVYDSRLLERDVQRLRALVSSFVEKKPTLLFSVKSNPNVHLLRAMSQWVDGFDVSSRNEYRALTEKIGLDPKTITVSGPAKTRPFLAELREKPPGGVHFDSIPEFERALPLAYPVHTHVTVRLTFPENSPKLGQDWSKWVPFLRKNGIRLSGLHIYLGRESFSAGLIVDALAEFRSAYKQDPDLFHDNVCWNLGLGLTGLESFTDEEILDLKEEFKQLPGDFRFELGRSLCLRSAVYVAEVLTLKPTEEADIVIIDGGLQHVSTPLFSRQRGLDVYTCQSLREGVGTEEFHIYGDFCLAKDIVFPKARLPAALRAGDHILFYPVGAYNVSAAASDFISLEHPSEFMIGGDGSVRDIGPVNRVSYIEAFE